MANANGVRVSLGLMLAGGLCAALTWLLWPGPAPPDRAQVQQSDTQSVEVDVPPPGTVALAVEGAGLSLAVAESVRGSIKSVSCFPELAGSDVLSVEELTPLPPAIQAMEGCLDLVGAHHPGQVAIELTVVFYLAADGSVDKTGVGADLATAEAYELLEPCARGYWLANAPKVRASDEKSFSCVFSWSAWSISGGAHRVGAQVPSVLSGRGSVAFGTLVTGQ